MRPTLSLGREVVWLEPQEDHGEAGRLLHSVRVEVVLSVDRAHGQRVSGQCIDYTSFGEDAQQGIKNRQVPAARIEVFGLPAPVCYKWGCVENELFLPIWSNLPG